MQKITLAFIGITAGFIALFTPTASAGGHHVPQRMVNAVVECQPAPARLEAACQALYLRPHYAAIVDGKAEMEECFTTASEEARPQSRAWKVYLGKCFRSVTVNPGRTA